MQDQARNGLPCATTRAAESRVQHRRAQRLRHQWVRRQLTRRVLPALRGADRGPADGRVPLRHSRRHRHPRTQGLRGHCDWPGALTLIHLISIPVTNTSVNPARSTGPALFAGDTSLNQLWLFFVAPIAGALIAGFTYKLLFGEGPTASLEQASAG